MGGVIKNDGKKKKENKIIDTKIPTILITKELLEKGRTIKEIAKERKLTQGTITQHIEEIVKKFPKTNISHIRPSQKIIDAVQEVNRKLKGDEMGRLNPIKLILDKQGKKLTFEEIRIARLFINE